MGRCGQTRSETALHKTNDSGRRVPSPTTAAAQTPEGQAEGDYTAAPVPLGLAALACMHHRGRLI
jgi:hypothetical protein